MTVINIVIKLLLVAVVIVISAITPCSSTISDRRLCFDPKCSVPVSVATTLMTYRSNHPAILSFKGNIDIQVYSKSAGKRKDLWGVEINGKRGYVPMRMIKEKQILKKSLLHDVPTEEVIASNDTTSDTNNVPKVAKINDDKAIEKFDEKVDDVSEKLGVRETEKIDEIVKEEKSRNFPELSKISPSFEVHDGTTIPVAVNEEPQEPSYSTSIPQIIPDDIGEHPVLSVHPNIASTVTLKSHANEISSNDDSADAEKYLKLAGLSEGTASNEIVNKKSDETFDESVSLDRNYTNETNNDHLSSNDVDSTTGEKTTNINELPVETSVSSGEEKPSESTKINGASSNNENSINTNDITNKIVNSVKLSDTHSNATDHDEQVAEEEKTTEPVDTRQEDEKTQIPVIQHSEEKETGTPVEQSHEEEKMTDGFVDKRHEDEKTEIPVEQHRDEKIMEKPVKQNAEGEKTTEIPLEQSSTEEEYENKPMESTTEPTTSESLENNSSTEKIVTNEIDLVNSDKKIADDLDRFMEDNDKTINPINATADGTHVEEVVKIDAEALKDFQESENSNMTENEIPVDEEGSIEKSVEEESTDQPLNLNIMNPLFSRLSMLPSIVKEVVGNTLLSNSESKTSDEEIVEKEEVKNIHEEIVEKKLKNSNENDITETSSTTENLPHNIDKGDIDDSVEAENSAKSDTTKPKILDSNIDKIVNKDNNNLDSEKNKNTDTADSNVTAKAANRDFLTVNPVQPGIYKEDDLSGFRQEHVAIDETSNFNGFPANRNLLNVGSVLQPDDHKSAGESSKVIEVESSTESGNEKSENAETTESLGDGDVPEIAKTPDNNFDNEQNIVTETADSCLADSSCENLEVFEENHNSVGDMEDAAVEEEIDIMDVISKGRNYWETLTYLVVTAFTTLLFSLGYYYIENTRRDGQYIAKINKLEKELLVCSKECTVLDDTLKSTKTKLDSIEDESFGSNEMVASLKTDLEASKTAKSELEDQVAMLEKELESATEAGLELERMLREILSTNNEDNPLAQSVEDLQTRLNAQQAANEALTNALNLKAQENENLTAELKATTLKSEQLEVEVTRITEELKRQNNLKSNLEHGLMEKIEQLETQIKSITAERINLRKQLKGKEMELKDLLEVVNQMNISNLDFEKLYNVSTVKAEASQLLEERDDLKIRLSEVEGAHQLLEEHVKLINEEVSSLSERCKLAEKAKRDAETRVEVLSNFFKEKEAQRQKEEAVWLQKQGEVSSTVERLHTMQNEIHNYKQQIEMLKREILDQEREYKNQISSLETKSHEHWVIARQNERRLEESKAEAGQLRNRLTLIEKNINDIDPEAKLHRLESNGETATSPQLFIGAEASSSPIMFTGSSGVPLPPPPSYLYGPPVPPFMPPPPHSSSGISSYEVGQRPPPLGGRLSSPPPLHGTNSGRYDNPRSPPPPLSPSMIPAYGPPHRAYPPPFPNDRIHPPPPPPPHSSLLPPFSSNSSHTWADEALPPLRNSGFQPHQQQPQHHHHHSHHPPHHRENQQRARNHKGSLHSSGESLDKNL